MEKQAEVSRKSLATEKLYDAAVEGDLISLLYLFQEDSLILDRCIMKNAGHYTQSPLHVAVRNGHLEFIREILNKKPELAEELDLSRRWSPLHIASSKGLLEIVRALVAVNPNMCFARDQDGRNPVHVAAIYGQAHVLEELLQAKMQAGRERANGGETIMHLCIKYSQSEALKVLLDVMDAQLINAKDNDGNNVLHLAVVSKQPEMVDIVLKNTSIDIDACNANGLTATDISTQSIVDLRSEEILHSLKLAKAVQATNSQWKLQNKNRTWLQNQRSALMVVASLIATMAFQVGVNPPGGLWQDDTAMHTAGTSVLATKAPGRYNVMLISNTIGLFSSLGVIILLISGLPCKRLFMGVLMFTMWIATSATTFTYLIAVLLIFDLDFYKTKIFDVTPGHWKTFYIALISWDCLMALLLTRHIMRFIVSQSWLKMCKNWFSRATNHPLV